jgi:hypothetical protein
MFSVACYKLDVDEIVSVDGVPWMADVCSVKNSVGMLVWEIVHHLARIAHPLITATAAHQWKSQPLNSSNAAYEATYPMPALMVAAGVPCCSYRSYRQNTHLTVPYGGRQDARLEPKYKQIDSRRPRGVTGADECEPVQTARPSVSYKASQDALGVSM